MHSAPFVPSSLRELGAVDSGASAKHRPRSLAKILTLSRRNSGIHKYADRHRLLLHELQHHVQLGFSETIHVHGTGSERSHRAIKPCLVPTNVIRVHNLSTLRHFGLRLHRLKKVVKGRHGGFLSRADWLHRSVHRLSSACGQRRGPSLE